MPEIQEQVERFKNTPEVNEYIDDILIFARSIVEECCKHIEGSRQALGAYSKGPQKTPIMEANAYILGEILTGIRRQFAWLEGE